MKEITAVLKQFTNKTILVIGDVMLDHYIWGNVERISPEAPVPVLDVQKEEYRLGGAANVALNLKTLGAEVLLCGLIGNDEAGKKLVNLLSKKGIKSQTLTIETNRSTTLKTRIGAVTQQIVRIDHEHRLDITAKVENQVVGKLEKVFPEIDAVIVEDYNKGIMTKKVIEAVTKLAAKHHKLLAVDPKQKNFFLYKNADVFKPNYNEMQKNLGVMFENESEFATHAKQLKTKLNCKNLVITRGEKGLYIYSDKERTHQVPTFAREVYDVSGAGDTVISALTLALCSGCDIKTAAIIANHAAGVVCGKMGTAVATIKEIRESFNDHK